MFMQETETERSAGIATVDCKTGSLTMNLLRNMLNGSQGGLLGYAGVRYTDNYVALPIGSYIRLSNT